MREKRDLMRTLRVCGLMTALVCGGFSAGGSAIEQGDPARAFDAATAAARKPGTTVRIDLVGDSTQTENAGYGRGFCANFTRAVDCLDMAKGGASTRTFREGGLWDRVLATRPDYAVIQFGHNDLVTREHMDRQVPLPQYVENLKRYVTEARAAGIKPVLVTPLTRRFFEADGKIHSDLGEYSEAMRGVARGMKVPLIELQNESIAYLDKAGEDAGDKLAITKKDADGKTIFDKTHLNWQGSYVFGRMVAVDLGKAVPALRKYVWPTAAPLPPEGVKAMRILGSPADGGAPVTIVLVGDSTVATEGGWGPGFCAVMTKNVTCDDVALNGRSTKSFRDEGAWAKALALHGDYYLIQFGHNDQKIIDPKRYASPEQYAANLKQYVADVRTIGAVPVIVTPLSRRTFVDGEVKEDLKEYADAAREAAAQEDITCVDLNGLSTKLLNSMGQEKADELDATGHADQRAENGQAKVDRTHLNDKGKAVFGRIVADQLVRTQVELGRDVVGLPASQPGVQAAQEVWRFDQIASLGGHPTEVLGHPEVIETEYGKAVHFNGAGDALFVGVHPLAGAATWTWEMIFRPDADGAPAQRIFHLQVKDAATGVDTRDRMLFEIRVVKGQWCLDSFAQSGTQRATLLNCEKLHPLGQWARVTAVYDGNVLRNYVADELQGEARLTLEPQGQGHTSMGTRIDQRDYFKGAILEARFTREALGVPDFFRMPAKP